ncbi:phage tail assembly protein [Kaistia sp. MMO-174]|uniref:phage tail assembly protein n=1 Tax=Kaistia sp. MMO-174 TaxID=3081256 RepID=UPI003019DD9D
MSNEPVPTGQPAGAPAAAVYDNEAARFEVVPLEWPVTINGVRFERIVVRRMTVNDIATFIENAAKSPDQITRFPMYDVPDEVLGLLDADDGERIEEVSQRFLPRRFRAAKASQPIPSDGAVSPQP